MTKREQLIAWLGDAHAMEVGIVSTLEKHIMDAEGLPKVRAALKKHLAETKQHATAMKQALESLGGSHPVIREGISKVMNLVAGLGTSLVKDTPVKNGIADFATEHFEIACYTSLVQTAESLGETKIATACRKILKEEQAMAKTLASQFKEVNATYLRGLDDDAPKKTDRPKPPLPESVVRTKPAAKSKAAAKKKIPTPKKTRS
jgi:ferritin-like metal-binding protein YciE